ncbi:MAG: hypothetical protein CMN76_11670 [Spirochaetaceae bacterium]|nr:hypothetical protein [Spirochaetaceae bacterium]
MRCIFVDNHFRGGVDSFLINLLTEWPQEDGPITLISNATNPALEAYRRIPNSGVLIRTYRTLVTRRSPFVFHSSATSLLWPLMFIARVVRRIGLGLIMPYYLFRIRFILRKCQCNRLLVVNGGYPGSYLARVATLESLRQSIPTIHNFHSHAVPLKSYQRMEATIDGRFARSDLTFVTVSRSCAKSLRKRIPTLSADRVGVIPNGVLPPTGAPAAGRRDALSPGGSGHPKKDSNLPRLPVEPFFLMLATYHAIKGHDTLIRAFSGLRRQYPQVRLIMCGDGSELDRRRIEALISENGVEDYAELWPFVEDKESLIREAVALVLPSRAQESFGLVLVEAMALGVPIIASSAGGIPEVFQSGVQGFLFEPGDSESLSIHMQALLADKGLRRKMAQEGKKLYKQEYTASRMANRYAELLREGSQLKAAK